MQSFSVAYDCYWYWIQEIRSQSPNSGLPGVDLALQENDELNSLSLVLGTSAIPNWSFDDANFVFDEVAFAAFFGSNDDLSI